MALGRTWGSDCAPCAAWGCSGVLVAVGGSTGGAGGSVGGSSVGAAGSSVGGAGSSVGAAGSSVPLCPPVPSNPWDGTQEVKRRDRITNRENTLNRLGLFFGIHIFTSH